uniref:ATP synthase epsilon chain, chloroplastic n=1 Tax=Eutreptia viridis TaxID=96908 RepID=H8ZXI0_9EUGL|nr:ATPase epsilon subunit [Eutreptia viridis]
MLVPDRVFWKNKATEIILPTLNGQIGVLSNHIPVLTGLDIGTILIRTSDSVDWLVICIMGGFALVKNNQITVLVNEAEFSSDIDIATAESLFLEAKTNLEKVSEGKQKLDANLQFKKAKARFQVVRQAK